VVLGCLDKSANFLSNLDQKQEGFSFGSGAYAPDIRFAITIKQVFQPFRAFSITYSSGLPSWVVKRDGARTLRISLNNGRVNVPADDSVIHLGDVIRLVGPKSKLLEFERVIGRKSSIDLKTVPS
jgi:hypothetical protein